MPSDRVSGYRAPNRESSVNSTQQRESRQVGRDGRSQTRDSRTSTSSPSGMRAGNSAQLSEAAGSTSFLQQVEEAANLGLSFVTFTTASGQTVFFTLSQLQNAGLLQQNNTAPSAEAEVPEPFVSAQSSEEAFQMPVRRGAVTSSLISQTSSTQRSVYSETTPRSINPQTDSSFDWVTQNRYMWEGLTQNNLMEDQIHDAKQRAQEADKSFVKIKQIALMVMMGDFVGALRAMTNDQEKFTKQIARAYLKQMNKSKDVKAMMYKTMANYSPPMNTGSTDPQTIANFQNKQAKYSQVMGLMTNTLQEVSSSDRQLTDGYTEVIRKLTESYELLSNVSEINSRAMRAITRG